MSLLTNATSSFIEMEKVYKISCKECQISFNLTPILSPLMNNSSVFVIQKYFLRNLLYGKDLKISKDQKCVQKAAKCLSCKKKLGTLIIFASLNMQPFINSVKLKKKYICVSVEKEDVNRQEITDKMQFYSNLFLDKKTINDCELTAKNTEKLVNACTRDILDSNALIESKMNKIAFIKEQLFNWFDAVIERKEKGVTISFGNCKLNDANQKNETKDGLLETSTPNIKKKKKSIKTKKKKKSNI